MLTAEWPNLIITLLEQEKELVWVVLLDTQGSTPRHAGASMLVRPNGSTVGSVGGGPLEAYAREQALRVLEDKRSRVDQFVLAASSEQAPGETSALPERLDMTCGGSGSLLFAYLSAQSPTWISALKDAEVATRTGQKAWLVLSLPPADAETNAEPDLVGLLCPEQKPPTSLTMPKDLLQATLEAVADATEHAPVVASKEGRRLIALPTSSKERLYIFGAGHCAQPLALLAHMVGFSVTVIDDRPEFATSDRFPSADHVVVCSSFSQAFADLAVDKNTYIVVMTRGHHHDKTVLAQALKTPACYVGMMGSKKKVAEIYRQLEAEGVSLEALRQVHAPVGLEIGADTPEEIAVSIAAELIKHRHERA